MNKPSPDRRIEQMDRISPSHASQASPGSTHQVNMGSEYTEDEVASLAAVERYKRERHRPYPSLSEILAVAVALGWRRVCPAVPLPRARK